MKRFRIFGALNCFAVFVLLAPAMAQSIDFDRYARDDSFNVVRLSPDGRHIAATVPLGDRTGMAVTRHGENRPVVSFQLGERMHIGDFAWVSPTRIVYAIAERFGTLEQPQPTGELMVLNVESGLSEMLVGQRVISAGPGTRIQPKQAERVAAFLVDELPDDPRNVIVSIWPLTNEPFSRAERLDLQSGRRTTLARAPVARARFTTDNAGMVRFARGQGSDNVNKLYHRAEDRSDWVLVNDESVSHRIELPLGFSADNRIAYLQVEQSQGPDAIFAWDTTSGERREILRNAVADPLAVITRFGNRVPVGAQFMEGRMGNAFFDAQSPEARTWRMLEQAFEGQTVTVTSTTADGKQALVHVSSDRNPGDYYLFDLEQRKADLVLSRRQWIDPAQQNPVRPVSFNARDGLPLHGYLTLPRTGAQGRLPLVVWVHGGPFGIFDRWQFDPEIQLLAEAGYAVLQINFRGSGNYGRAFTQAGASQWGAKMQDDVTDATRWAIAEGIADGRRICIGGASYGAYAAMMGVVREPDLYRCAVGYVGVYDLPMMRAADSRGSRSMATWTREWVGDDRALLEAASPNRLADRIKVPVFLAAGGKDEIAPIEHSRMMERALARAGVPVETLYMPSEGHGFYVEANRRQYYQRLIAFLGRHLGGTQAVAQPAAPPAATR